MNELIGIGWFFIVVLIMVGFIGIGMYILPRLIRYIGQIIKWRKFIKSEYDYENYED